MGEGHYQKRAVPPKMDSWQLCEGDSCEMSAMDNHV